MPNMFESYLRALRVALIATAVLPVVVLSASYLEGTETAPDKVFALRSLLTAAALAALGLGALRSLTWWKGTLAEASRQTGTFLDRIPDRHLALAIGASAAAGLFLELVIIRWQGCVFEVFAFYKNYSLLACFLGLGIGYALARRDAVALPLTIPLVAFQVLVLTVLRHGLTPEALHSLLATPVAEQLNMGLKVAETVTRFATINGFLVVVLLLTALAFVPIGQLCGRVMPRLSGLTAYGWNLLGSLVGVLLVFAVTFLWTPPVVWFGIGFLVLLAFQAFSSRLALIAMVSASATMVVLAWPISPGTEQIYSPYQILERGGQDGNRGLMVIRAAGHYFQRVHDLSSGGHRVNSPAVAQIAGYYELPYRLTARPPARVAVVGAGSGNDVAAALRMGATHVDAIEIDPAILELGRRYHPEQPYQDKRVREVVNDARSFFRNTPDKYDLVLYGLLDSHTLLSHASSVRLDSFVYTVEGFREARAALAPGGVLSLSFCVLSKEISKKIFLMLTEAFDGKPPVCVVTHYDDAMVFLQRNSEGPVALDRTLLAAAGAQDVTDRLASLEVDTSVATDDWPFFYMPRRVYPKSYLLVFAIVLLVSLWLIANFFGRQMELSHPAYFLMGAGFMLVETKGITEMGLTFGNTWQVIGVAISGILVMAFLGNLLVARIGIQGRVLPLLLVLVSLGLGWYVARHGGLPSSAVGRVGTVVVLTLPLLFSGIAFSSLVATCQNLPGAIAFNIMGAMLGGVLEYNAMYFGFSFLYLIALVLYGLALVSVVVRRPA